jgi:hypothetical protein
VSDQEAPRYESPERRYQTDVYFHAVVDMLEAQIHAAKLSPAEVREAGMLAAIHHEMRDPRPRLSFHLAHVEYDALRPPAGPAPKVIVDGMVYRLDEGAGRGV